MKFVREKIAEIYGILNLISDKKTTAKGAYAISKNKRLIEVEVKSIQDAYTNRSIPEGVQEFEKERIETCKAFADKDEQGEAVVVNSKFAIHPDKMEEFNKAIAELAEKHSEALKEKERLEQELVDLLQEEVDLPLHKIKFTDLPDDISASQIDSLGELIED
jgi:predicted transcriptional regulator